MFKVTFSDVFFEELKDVKEYSPNTVSILDFVSERYSVEKEDVTVVYKQGDILLEVNPVLWKNLKPKTGEYLVYAKPKDKDTLRTALTVALVAAGAAYATPFLAGTATAAGVTTSAGFFGLGGSVFGTAIVSAGVTMAATYLSQAIIPFETPDTPKTPKESSTLNITGSQNSIKAGAPIPYVIGTAKVTPPLAVNPIREAQGNDVWLTQVFCFGYGPLSGLTEANIKLGDQPLTSYEEYTLEIQDRSDTPYAMRRYDADAYQDSLTNRITLVQGDIQDAPQSVIIKQEDGARTFTTATDTEEFNIELTFNGLVRFSDSGKRKNRSVNVEVKYRKVGETIWRAFDGTGVSSSVDATFVVEKKIEQVKYLIDPPGEPPYTSSRSVSAYNYYIDTASATGVSVGSTIYVKRSGVNRSYNVFEVLNGGTRLKVGGYNIINAGVLVPYTYVKQYGSSFSSGSGVIGSAATSLTITDNTAETTYRTYKASNLDKGQYEVSIKRITADNNDAKIRDEFSVTNIRSIQKTDSNGDQIVAFPKELCYVALKIKATDQLNGVIGNLNCVVSSVTDAYSEADENFNAGGGSGNPAWEYLKLLTGPANKRFITAGSKDAGGDLVEDWSTVIDIDAFVDWANVCDEQVLSQDGVTLEPRYRYNTVVDYETTVGELAQKIATVGRAANSMLDGKYSIIYDAPNKPAVTRLTPANTYGFTASKSFARIPDAFRCKFVNKDKNYNVDEVIVNRDDDAVLNNDSLIQDINCDGITDPDQVYRYAKYAMAQLILRPEEYKVSTGIEHKYFRRGDVVSMTHDKIQGVLHYSRVKSISGLDVELDQGFQIDINYKATFRYSDTEVQDLSVYNIDSVIGNTITLGSVPVELQIGDLVIIGTASDKITKKYIVKNKIPKADDSCEVSLVDYGDPDIFAAEDGVIANYDAGDSSIIINNYSEPSKPELVSIVTDEKALLIGQDGSLITRAGFILKQPETVSGTRARPRPSFIEMQWRTVGGDGPFNKQTFDFTSGFIYVSGLQDGEYYDFRARYITSFGAASEFLNIDNTFIIGKTSKPADVDGFMYFQNKEGILFDWLPNEELDVKEYEIRTGLNWDDGVKIDRLRTNQKIVAPILSGSYVYFIKAIDVVNNFSENASFVNVYIANPSKPTGITAETIDNNINLKWGEPSSGFKIDYYNVYKETSAIVGGFEKIGYTYTTFFTRFETDAGKYTYYIEPVDVAGNIGERASVKVELEIPPDYILVNKQNADFNQSTISNGYIFQDQTITFDTIEYTFDTDEFTFDLDAAKSILFTVDENKTYRDFISELPLTNTFDSESDFTFDNDIITFDSGYTIGQSLSQENITYWMQKAFVEGGYYEVTIDYGTVIDATRVTATDTWSVIVDGLDKSYTISKSLDGISFDDFAGASQFFRDFRYVKLRIDLSSKSGSIKPLDTLEQVSFKLDLRKKYDSGNDIITIANDGKVVVFNQSFLDVQSITVTAKTDGTVAKYALYDFDNAGDQSQFTAYLFDTSGIKTDGEFSWTAEGY